MKGLGIAVLTLLASGTALTATAAQAQSWGYDSDVANRAYHSANVRDIQARRDQHAADVAAYYGDYGAANAYAHAADVRRNQANRDAHFAREESYDAHVGYWRGGWGY